MQNFDADAVVLKAKNLILADKTKIDDARMIFLEEIMDWSDFYTENINSSKEAAMGVSDSLIKLWLEFAKFEISLHQFKKAVEVFDKALSDPVAKRSFCIYESYAKFCVDRKKFANAQKVLIKGLCAGLSHTESDSLWQFLLKLMHEVNKSNLLTLDELFIAVKQQLDDKESLAIPSPLKNPSTQKTSNRTDSVKIKTEPSTNTEEVNDPHEVVPVSFNSTPIDISDNTTTQGASSLSTQIKKESVNSATPPSVETGKEIPLKLNAVSNVDDLDNTDGLTPEQIVRIYNLRPPMIFSAPHKEPMLSGVSGLQKTLVKEIEVFFNLPISAVVQATLPYAPPVVAAVGDSLTVSKVKRVADLLEALWSAQAMKERHFDAWIVDLRTYHENQEKLTMDNIEKKRQGFSVLDFETYKQTEMDKFFSRCAVQRELQLSLINKILYNILTEQQSVLAKIGLPHFSSNVVDRIHSCFAARRSSLEINLDRHPFEADNTIFNAIATQKQVVCGLLSARLKAMDEAGGRGENSPSSDGLDQRRSARKRRRIVTPGDSSPTNNRTIFMTSPSYNSFQSTGQMAPRGLQTRGGRTNERSYSSRFYPDADASRQRGGRGGRGRGGRGYQQNRMQTQQQQNSVHSYQRGALMDVVNSGGVQIQQNSLPLLHKLATLMQNAKK